MAEMGRVSGQQLLGESSQQGEGGEAQQQEAARRSRGTGRVELGALLVLQTQLLIFRFQMAENPDGEPLAGPSSAGTIAFEQLLALPSPESHAEQSLWGIGRSSSSPQEKGPSAVLQSAEMWAAAGLASLAVDKEAGQERLLWHWGFHPGPALRSRSIPFCLWRRRVSAGEREAGQGSSLFWNRPPASLGLLAGRQEA